MLEEQKDRLLGERAHLEVHERSLVAGHLVLVLYCVSAEPDLPAWAAVSYTHLTLPTILRV